MTLHRIKNRNDGTDAYVPKHATGGRLPSAEAIDQAPTPEDDGAWRDISLFVLSARTNFPFTTSLAPSCRAPELILDLATAPPLTLHWAALQPAYEPFTRKADGRPNFQIFRLPGVDVPQFTYALHDLSARTDAEIKGDVLTRLVQLALRWIFSDQPVARLRELIALIEQVQDHTTAVEVLESLLQWSERILTADSVESLLH